MSRYPVEPLAAARHLVARGQRPRGRMPAALVRRSTSTSYYALFHFLLEEATARIVGTAADLLRRRRVTARAFTHTGTRQALERVQKPQVAPGLQTLFGVAAPPAFARTIGQLFSRAQEQRREADYGLNAALSEPTPSSLRPRSRPRFLNGSRREPKPIGISRLHYAS